MVFKNIYLSYQAQFIYFLINYMEKRKYYFSKLCILKIRNSQIYNILVSFEKKLVV